MIDVADYLRVELRGYLKDRPEGSFERGYLAALLRVARDCKLLPDTYLDQFDRLTEGR